MLNWFKVRAGVYRTTNGLFRVERFGRAEWVLQEPEPSDEFRLRWNGFDRGDTLAAAKAKALGYYRVWSSRTTLLEAVEIEQMREHLVGVCDYSRKSRHYAEVGD